MNRFEKTILAIIVICGICCISSLVYEYMHPMQFDNNVYEEKFTYEKHEYIKFMKSGEVISICHNPECKECFEIFD